MGVRPTQLTDRIGVSGISQASRRVALQIKDDKKLKKD